MEFFERQVTFTLADLSQKNTKGGMGMREMSDLFLAGLFFVVASASHPFSHCDA